MDGNAMTNVLGGDQGSIVDDKQDKNNNNVRQLAERETDIHVGDSSLSQAPVADVQSREIDVSVIGASLAGPSTEGDTPKDDAIDREKIMRIIFNDDSNGYNEQNLDWDTMKELYSAVQQNHGMTAVLVEPPSVLTHAESNHVVVGESDSTPLDAEQVDVVSASTPEANSDNSQVVEESIDSETSPQSINLPLSENDNTALSVDTSIEQGNVHSEGSQQGGSTLDGTPEQAIQDDVNDVVTHLLVEASLNDETVPIEEQQISSSNQDEDPVEVVDASSVDTFIEPENVVHSEDFQQDISTLDHSEQAIHDDVNGVEPFVLVEGSLDEQTLPIEEQPISSSNQDEGPVEVLNPLSADTSNEHEDDVHSGDSQHDSFTLDEFPEQAVRNDDVNREETLHSAEGSLDEQAHPIEEQRISSSNQDETQANLLNALSANETIIQLLVDPMDDQSTADLSRSDILRIILEDSGNDGNLDVNNMDYNELVNLFETFQVRQQQELSGTVSIDHATVNEASGSDQTETVNEVNDQLTAEEHASLSESIEHPSNSWGIVDPVLRESSGNRIGAEGEIGDFFNFDEDVHQVDAATGNLHFSSTSPNSIYSQSDLNPPTSRENVVISTNSYYTRPASLGPPSNGAAPVLAEPSPPTSQNDLPDQQQATRVLVNNMIDSMIANNSFDWDVVVDLFRGAMGLAGSDANSLSPATAAHFFDEIVDQSLVNNSFDMSTMIDLFGVYFKDTHHLQSIKSRQSVQQPSFSFPPPPPPPPPLLPLQLHDCPICLDEIIFDPNLAQPDPTLKRLACTHIFHLQCIQTYFLQMTRPLCPMCRQHVPLEDTGHRFL